MQRDATTFAEWGVDLVKYDGCNFPDQTQAAQAYGTFGRWLNKTGKGIVYSCEWPMYDESAGITVSCSGYSSLV